MLPRGSSSLDIPQLDIRQWTLTGQQTPNSEIPSQNRIDTTQTLSPTPTQVESNVDTEEMNDVLNEIEMVDTEILKGLQDAVQRSSFLTSDNNDDDIEDLDQERIKVPSLRRKMPTIKKFKASLHGHKKSEMVWIN